MLHRARLFEEQQTTSNVKKKKNIYIYKNIVIFVKKPSATFLKQHNQKKFQPATDMRVFTRCPTSDEIVSDKDESNFNYIIKRGFALQPFL